MSSRIAVSLGGSRTKLPWPLDGPSPTSSDGGPLCGCIRMGGKQYVDEGKPSETAERVRNRSGYDPRLAARIQGNLRLVYPDTMELPERLTDHPSYIPTLYALQQLGHIELPQGGGITRDICGDLSSTNINRAAPTVMGYAATQRNWTNVIRVGAAIITAVSTGIVAAVTLMQSSSSPLSLQASATVRRGRAAAETDPQNSQVRLVVIVSVRPMVTDQFVIGRRLTNRRGPGTG